MGHDNAVLSRRGLLAGGAAIGAVAATGLGAAPAEAAVVTGKVVIKKVVLQRPIRYKYVSRTRTTLVTKYKKVTVVARFNGASVYLKNVRGAWERAPYVYSKKAKALVYSHYLTLVWAAEVARAKALAAAAAKAAAAARAAAAAKAAADAAAAQKAAQEAVLNNPAGGYRVIAPPIFQAASAYQVPDMARHVLRRAGYGPTPSDLADIGSLGYARWLEFQLNPSTVYDPLCDSLLTRITLPQSTPIWKVRREINNGTINGWEQQQDVLRDFATRALWSKRQLLTVLEDFWGNHFNVTVPGDNIDDSRAHYSYVIRANALGKFSDLLRAVSKHPAMLTYLNNRDSTYEHPNENQGRELLELHTVGVDGGYGETGVINAARILTGLSVENESGEFEYKPWNHWVGAVQVLGFTHPNPAEIGGEQVADALFDYLARHPTTAHRLAHKLAVRFVSDTPSQALVDLLAATYLRWDTAIQPVLRVLFSSQEFASSVGAKMHRPFEHAIAVARLMQSGPSAADLDAPLQLVWMADDAGDNPFGQPFPTGQADTADQWRSTAAMLFRWNNCINIVNKWWPNSFVRPDLRSIAVGPTLPATHGALVDQVATNLFGQPLAPAHKAAVLTFLGATDAKPVTASSSAVNGGLGNFVAVLLDSPYQTLR